MNDLHQHSCVVCGVLASKRCSTCATSGIDLFFCSHEHQKLVWPNHKVVCGQDPVIFPDLSDDEARQIGTLAHRELSSPVLQDLPASIASKLLRRGKISLARSTEVYLGASAGDFDEVLLPFAQDSTIADGPDIPAFRHELLLRLRNGLFSLLNDLSRGKPENLEQALNSSTFNYAAFLHSAVPGWSDLPQLAKTSFLHPSSPHYIATSMRQLALSLQPYVRFPSLGVALEFARALVLEARSVYKFHALISTDVTGAMIDFSCKAVPPAR
ncbi:zinc finger MYND domain-containing protein [Rhodotorula paludigena]|uniref:zinc finger MYND domain-containing protein n=1 Tax=Rhodotorula paludigena TaxID=86838 RepID=UPI003175CD5B